MSFAVFVASLTPEIAPSPGYPGSYLGCEDQGSKLRYFIHRADYAVSRFGPSLQSFCIAYGLAEFLQADADFYDRIPYVSERFKRRYFKLLIPAEEFPSGEI